MVQYMLYSRTCIWTGSRRLCCRLASIKLSAMTSTGVSRVFCVIHWLDNMIYSDRHWRLWTICITCFDPHVYYVYSYSRTCAHVVVVGLSSCDGRVDLTEKLGPGNPTPIVELWRPHPPHSHLATFSTELHLIYISRIVCTFSSDMFGAQIIHFADLNDFSQTCLQV